MNVRHVVAASCLAIAVACSPASSELTATERSHIEFVMSPGMSISATTPNGPITVKAISDLGRSYQFGSTELKVTMWPREERWYGSLGLYYPAPDFGIWRRRGIYRAVVEEGQQHFETVDDALAWLQTRSGMPHVYRNDGLVVGWSTTPERNQLNAEVWQIYIHEKKPSVLPGSDDSRITVATRSPN